MYISSPKTTPHANMQNRKSDFAMHRAKALRQNPKNHMLTHLLTLATHLKPQRVCGKKRADGLENYTNINMAPRGLSPTNKPAVQHEYNTYTLRYCIFAYL